MIKIEKISAINATIERGGLRQPLVLHSHITAAELATIEAESGTIVYSVDEAEVKELTFQAPAAATKPGIKQPTPRTAKPAAQVAEPVVESPSAETPAE